jgi:hypothetical protein
MQAREGEHRMSTQTGEEATAVQKARETRRRMRQLGAPEVGEVALLAAVFDLHERLAALEKRLAAQPRERAERTQGD